MAACNSLVTAVCNREAACNNLNGTPVAACITAAETNLNCSSASCPAGTTFSSSAANQCVSDVNNESCTDIQNEDTPASCSTTCH